MGHYDVLGISPMNGIILTVALLTSWHLQQVEDQQGGSGHVSPSAARVMSVRKRNAHYPLDEG